VQVMLLAAGRGTRLGELGRQTPKVLVEIGGQPLLGRQIDYLAREGAELVVVNAHHLSEQIVEFVEGRDHPCRVEVIVEPDLLGTAGGIRNALDHFERHLPIVVLNGDTLLDAPLERIVNAHLESGAAGTICASWLEDTTGKGVLEVDPRGDVIGFEEKPASSRPGLASAGLYVLDRELVAIVPPDEFFDLAEDLFPLAHKLELTLRAEPLEGAFADIGTPESLADARGEAAR
jgi:NDP-sugar pyrophosphorylase family protein